MTKKNDIVIVSKDVAYWTNTVKNLKTEISNYENVLKYSRACLVMSEEKLSKAIALDK